MLKRDGDSPTTREEPIENFRVFTLGEDGRPAYDQPLTKNGDSPQFLFYVFVSIMNSLFTDKDSAPHMISETQMAYGESYLPILFACGDTIYNITKDALFNLKGKTTSPVEKATEQWDKQYKKAAQKLHDQGKPVNHESITWSTFEKVSERVGEEENEYADFRQFTDAIITSELTLESLKSAFPKASPSVLQALFEDIQNKGITENLAEIAKEYTAKNIDKLGAAVKSETKWQKNRLAELTRLELDNREVKGYHVSTLAERQEKLRHDTYSFLANECTVFLLLSSLTDTVLIKEKLHLQSTALTDSTSVKPVFSYPISSSPGAELIFATFLKINQLYCQYYASLGLSAKTELAIFVDSLVPTNLNPHHAKKESDTDSTSSGELPQAKAAAVYEKGRTSPTMFKDDIEVFVKMVTKTMSQRGRTDTIVNSPHGVSCKIVRGEKSDSSEEDRVLLSDVLDDIREAARDSLQKFSKSFGVYYNGYHFQLEVGPTILLQSQVKL